MIASLAERVDALVIGGAMAFTLIAAEGGKVGASLVEEDKLDEVRDALAAARSRGVPVHLPVDVVAAPAIDADAPTEIVPADGVPEGLMGLDIGPATVAAFTEALAGAGSILWNGPMGVFELEPFAAGTRGGRPGVRRERRRSPSSAAATPSRRSAREGLADAFDHLSTGGGASLEYLEGRRCPGSRSWRTTHDRSEADHRRELEDAQDAPGGDPGRAEARLPPGQGRHRPRRRS